MKKFIKENSKLILASLITAIVCISGTVFATVQFNASQISYNDQPLDLVLDDLYTNLNNDMKFEVKPLFKDGIYYNQDKIKINLFNTSISSNQIVATANGAGVYTKNLENKKHCIIYKLTRLDYTQFGQINDGATLPSIVTQGTGRVSFVDKRGSSYGSMPIWIPENTSDGGTFLASVSGGSGIIISEISYFDLD